ncbi:MAG: hypothetical protein JWN70_4744 [Planctomycetaceae bacterium]|nr:hypothetical protein [Planctomycetaceae bacterium]
MRPCDANSYSPCFSEGLAAISEAGYINSRGELSVKWPHHLGLPFQQGLASVRGEVKCTFGYLDPTGAMAIGPCSWNHQGESFDTGFAVIQPTADTVALIDRAGEWAVGPAFRAPGWRYSGGWIEKRAQSKVLMENIVTGVSFQLDESYHLRPFSDGICIATIPESEGALSTFTAINEDGTIAFSRQSWEQFYNLIDDFHGGLALFDGGSEVCFGYINKQGEVQIPDRFRYAYAFQEGLAPVCPYDKSGTPGWGFIDASGDYVIEPRDEFKGADCFSEGMAAVCAWNMSRDDPPRGEYDDFERWGYIDVHGAWTIPPVFSYAGPFREGFASVRFKFVNSHDDLYDSDGELNESHCSRALISQDGTFIWPPKLNGRNIKEVITADPRGPKQNVPPFLVLLRD